VGVLQWGVHEQIPADIEKGEGELAQLEGFGVGLEGFSPSLSTVVDVGRRDASELESQAYRAMNYIRIACGLKGHPKLRLYRTESFWGRDDLEASLPCFGSWYAIKRNAAKDVGRVTESTNSR
jgi:hypothetical protein